MGTLPRAILVAAFVVGASPAARADAKGDIAGKTKEAMENYDLMDYGAATKLLNQALATAKKAKLDKDPVVAKVYLHLGIAAFADNDPDAALVDFQSAIEIDPKIQIEAAYKSPELTKLLEQARSGGGGGTDTAPSDGVDCASVKGLQHVILDSGKGGVALPIEATVGADLSPSKVVVGYRVAGATDFTEVPLEKTGACRYTGQIPAKAMHGTLVHYYVAALGANGKPIAARGSQGSPNLLDIEGGGAVTVGDDEDPIGGGKTTTPVATGGDISGGVVLGGKQPKVYLQIAAGTGAGYVRGKTELGSTVQTCCIGASLVVLTPELGFYAGPRTSIGIAGRFGIPVGANQKGHSTLAPAGLLRIRYSLAADGAGLRVMGQIGAGVMRNTIKLDNMPSGSDTDIVAQGPLLFGAGIGYLKRLSGNVAFLFDVSVLAGIAVVDHIGTATLNSGVSGDASLGLAFGF